MDCDAYSRFKASHFREDAANRYGGCAFRRLDGRTGSSELRADRNPCSVEYPNQPNTETNSWMATFAPVAAIGIGISIALAVLGYLGKMIKSAFN